MKVIQPKQGIGRFQWNAGGWFGALLGSTCFLLLGAISFLSTQPLLSVVWLAAFIISVAIGVFLWNRRDHIAPYAAIQGLLLTIGLFSTVAILAARAVAPEILANVNMSPISSLWLLAIFPGMMLLFHLLELAARNRT